METYTTPAPPARIPCPVCGSAMRLVNEVFALTPATWMAAYRCDCGQMKSIEKTADESAT
ncbi:MAG TPA: hypothetical protein VIU40_13970 [Geobacteraceae bacterium]